jgi:hypothetical protein
MGLCIEMVICFQYAIYLTICFSQPTGRLFHYKREAWSIGQGLLTLWATFVIGHCVVNKEKRGQL